MEFGSLINKRCKYDRDDAESAIKFVYKLCGEPKPKFVWVEPQDISDDNALNGSFDSVCLDMAIHEKLKESNRGDDLGFLNLLHAMSTVSEYCGFWVPYKGICICSEKPLDVHVLVNPQNGNFIFHREDGAAITYPGIALYFKYGDKVSKESLNIGGEYDR